MPRIKQIEWLLKLTRTQKRFVMLAADFVFIIISLWASFSLRLGEIYIPEKTQLWIFVAAPVIAFPIFIRFGLYRAIIRYIGFHALWAIVQSVSLYALVWAALVLIANVDDIPRTVYLLNFILTIFLIGIIRIMARWLFNDKHIRGFSKSNLEMKNVVIYGAGSAGLQLTLALGMEKGLRPVAFIDDDVSLHNHQINGLKIYSFLYLSNLIEKYNVQEILLALPSVSKSRRKEIISLLEPYSVHVRTIPDLSEVAQGNVKVEDIQEVDIYDLLGRDTIPPNVELLNANISGKSVLVTGAGGSIGSELCRQIIRLRPEILVLYEISEFQLYAIEKELEFSANKSCKIVPILGSVVDKDRISQVCKAFQVNTIYHAAAYKHVPMVERNPGEAIRNNIFGTLHSAEAALENQVETFVLISTDKAVRPTNTMGATKRFSELILQALSMESSVKTRFTMVRFGNVLGSSGSVVPLFRKQIEQGGPVTVTDPKIIRYFMTIPEAAELVIQAGAMGHGGDVFVLDMGEPVRIVDLAKRMIHLSGLTKKDTENPDGDIAIEYTGLRPGEKLYEELLIGENVLPTDHEKIMRAEEEVVALPEIRIIMSQLEDACMKNDYDSVRALLKETVSGFKPQCDVVDEVQLALYKLTAKTNVVTELSSIR